MRKITSLLMLFCMCVGAAFAQTSVIVGEGDEGAASVNWTTESWASQQATPAGVTAVEKGQYPSKSSNVKAMSISATVPAGVLSSTLVYSSGNNRLDILGVDLLDGSGNVLATDYHFGFSGGNKVFNIFRLDVATAGTYTVRYWVSFCAENNTSSGTINLVSKTVFPAASANEFRNNKVFTVTPAANASTGVWDVKDDKTMLCLSRITGRDANPTTASQQFAFLTVNGEIYLYSPWAEKFVVNNKDGNGGQLLTDELSSKCLVQILNSTISTNKSDYPIVVKVGDNQLHSTYQNYLLDKGGIITTWDHTESGGNAVAIVPVAEMDLTAAIAKIDAYQATREKGTLNNLITEATALATKAFYGEAKIQALNTAIANAQTVYDNNAATYAQVAEQITALTAAITNTAYVTTVEQFSNNAIYTFVANRNATSYMMYDGTNNFVASKWKQTSLEAGEDNANCQWAVYKSAKGNYYMYNLGAQMFMGTETAANTGIPFSETPQTTSLGFKVSAVASHPIMITPNGGSGAVNHSNSNLAGFTNNYGVINWSGGYGYVDDGGNVHKVTIVGAIDDATLAAIQEKVERYENVDIILSKAKALYETVLADNGKTVGQYTINAIYELAIALDNYETNPTEEYFGYVKAAYNYILENGEKVTLNAGDKFTIKQIGTRGYVVYSAVEGMGSEENVYLASSNYTNFHPAIDAEGVYKYWSLYEFGGKKYIYNVGNSKAISPNGSVIKFVGEPTAIEIVDLGNAESAIYLESSKNYLEASPGFNHVAVRTYDNTQGEGARFIIVKEEGTVDPTEIEQAYFNNWKEGALASLGYVGGYASSTKDEITAITTMDGFAEFVKENDKIQLTAGHYFIKGTGVGNNANWYITYGDNGTDFIAKALASGEKLGAKHIWSFDEIKNENGYKLKSVNLDKYATTSAASATSQVTSNYNSGYKFVFTDNGAGKFTIKDGNGNVLRTEDGGQLNHSSSETNETWYVIPAVELDITLGAEYGTIHLPFDVTLPAEGLKAYAVTAVSDTHATLEEKADVKANEGVILQGQGTHKLTIATATSDWTGNMLKGSNVNTYVNVSAYVLANGENGLGLYKAALNKNENGEEGTTHFLNNANKAYLPIVNPGVNALRFNFDGETTAIDAVEVENANAPIYDLSGRRVLTTVKGGIYIQNGKKFIVK